MAMVPPTGGKNEGPYIPCPSGLQQAVCCDVVDLGMVQNKWDGKARMQHKVQIRWQSQNRMKDGRPFLVQKRYTFSLSEKATLRKDINMWRGKTLTDEEAKTFDLERLIGINAYLVVVHTKRNDKVYADVVGLSAVPKGIQRLVVTDYARKIVEPAAPAEPSGDDDGPDRGEATPPEPPPPDDEPEF